MEALTNVVGRLASLNTALAQMAQTSFGLLAEQAQLRDQGTPDADQAKIGALQASFLDQLRDAR